MIFKILSGKELKRFTLICFAIVILISLLYFNSLRNNFVNWDDPGLILQNKRIRSLEWNNIREIFTLRKSTTFQPIRVLSYAVDYHFWKLNPEGYRITNILFYILTSIMVYLTLLHLSKHFREKALPDSHGRVAIFGALLFAAHPVHVEAVTWLSARKEVLQGFFFFLAFYAYLRGRGEDGSKRIFYLALVFASFLLAVLSKPSAVVFPGVILLYEIAKGKEIFLRFFKKNWIFIIATLVVSGISIFIMMKIMIEAGGVKPFPGDSLAKNFLVWVYVFLQNTKLLFATINFSAAYSLIITLPFLCVKNIILISIILSLITISILSLRWTKIIFFSFFFFLLTLLPYLNIVPISTLKADRYVFIASFSYVFFLGIVFDRLYAYRHKMFSEGFFKLLSVGLFLFFLVGYSFMTIRQNAIWENSYTLWADAVEKHPESSAANALMGVVYMDLGMDQDGVKYLEKAVQLLPHDYLSRNNLGIIYGRQGEPEKALREFVTAIQLKPDDDTIKINLSVFYQRHKEYKKAEEVLQYLLSKSPQNANLHFRLGLIYRDAGRNEEAVSEFLRCIEFAPHIINGYEELGNIYATRFGNLEKAKYFYGKGIEAAPEAKARIEGLRWMIQDLER